MYLYEKNISNHTKDKTRWNDDLKTVAGRESK